MHSYQHLNEPWHLLFCTCSNISKVKEVAFTKYPALGVTVNSTYLELLKLVPQLDPPTLKVVELLLLQDGPVTDAALNVRFGATLLAALVEGVQAVPLKYT